MRPDRFRKLRRVLDRRQPDLTVLMERVSKSHNFSAILRNCDAAGVLEAHAVPPDRGLDLHADTSGGTAKWIQVHRHPDGPSAIRFLQGEGFQVVAAHPGPRAVDFRAVDFTRPTALLMGAELYGVSVEALELSDVTAVIPMMGMVRSLNVSVAAAILLYEAIRQREIQGMYDPPSRLSDTRYAETLFEWAYPELATRLRRRGLPYPELGEEGEIVGSLDGLREAGDTVPGRLAPVDSVLGDPTPGDPAEPQGKSRTQSHPEEDRR
jgi:tRNA (guanosine-2'-O-)-methyltransferase